MNEFPSDTRSVCAVRYAIVKIIEAAALVGIHILESKYGVAVETFGGFRGARQEEGGV
ncbi:MAG: hypothetical protein QW291_09195 [Thermofilaceae archaeon]